MPRVRVSPEFVRVRNLIALDAQNIMGRLEQRKDEMIALFSKLRDREPLISTLRSWFPSTTFKDLAVLDAPQQTAVNRFYEQLEQLRWYFQYTDDMPGSAQLVFLQHHKRLQRAWDELNGTLGPPVAVKDAIPPVPKLSPPVRRAAKGGTRRGK